MVKVAGYTQAEAAAGMFWLNVAMMFAFLLWGWANPWLTRQGLSATRLMKIGLPVNLLLIAVITLSGSALGDVTALVWTLYCVTCTVGSLAQPAVGMAFAPQFAGRALSAYNLMVFAGVFAVQWGVGLMIDGFRASGWSEPAAYQGAMGVYGLCGLWAYVHLLRAKTP